MKRKWLAKSIWALLLLVMITSLGGDTFGNDNPVVRTAQPHLFSIVRWEIGNFTKKWTHAFRELFPGSRDQEEEVREVRRYFELADPINEVKAQLNRVLAGLGSGSDRGPLEEQLSGLGAQRKRLEAGVERTLEGMISRVLKDNGITSKFLFLRHLWPPLDLRLSEVPKVLIISPRDRIELQETHLLDPEITPGEIESLEDALDGRDLSSLVEGSSGVATYPSLVRNSRSLKSVLRIASHEWVHHYLFFHPLGRRYWASGDLTTLNETVADIVGDEIGREVYRRYFATEEEAEPSPAPDPADDGRPGFDLGRELRETRLGAERLLGQGKVEEAEAYMEERRLFLAENGHVIRKLNQAFFAFHGTYADRPGSINPIGGQLRALRERSPTLSAFLFQVARYSSPEDLRRDLGG